MASGCIDANKCRVLRNNVHSDSVSVGTLFSGIRTFFAKSFLVGYNCFSVGNIAGTSTSTPLSSKCIKAGQRLAVRKYIFLSSIESA